jgi:hypothetical protein
MNITKRQKPKVILLASIISIVLGSVIVPSVQAVTINPAPVCNATGTSCTVNFPYSGDYYIWSPPADVRTMNIALSGAQGGRSGGNGGRTYAVFNSIPKTPLYIFVGGQGSSGNGAAGGYNGGGSAGFGHNDEGSGGGATDIRTSALLADRIAVAGGGGGTGGWVGGVGGAGSGSIGVAGANGQGFGGGAGTQSAGGLGGSSNGSQTTAGSSGGLGVGGSGGSANSPSSLVAGGGGGGGGYFGGGGGGADTDSSGTDGGGGGAGSSFVSTARFQSYAYTAAWQPANGAASITYNYGPTVSSFAGPSSPSKLATPSFNIKFGQSVTGLTADDFTISGSAQGCYISNLTGSGANYTILVTGCSDGTLVLTLKADTVFGNAIGPLRSASTPSVTLDRTVPEIESLTKQPSSNDLIIYKATFSEPVTGLVADNTDWLIKGNGCLIQTMTGSGAQYIITISSCVDGNLAGLVLNSQAVQDGAGNIGPSLENQTAVTKIDTTAPILRVTDITAPGATGVPMWVFDSEEPATGMSAEMFTFSGTATACVMNYSVVRENLGWQITLSDCGIGSAQVTLAANSVVDIAGNSGPVAALASNVINIEPDEIVNQTIDSSGESTPTTIQTSEVTSPELNLETPIQLADKEIVTVGEKPSKPAIEKEPKSRKPKNNQLKEISYIDKVESKELIILAFLSFSIALSAFAAGRTFTSSRRH